MLLNLYLSKIRFQYLKLNILNYGNNKFLEIFFGWHSCKKVNKKGIFQASSIRHRFVTQTQ